MFAFMLYHHEVQPQQFDNLLGAGWLLPVSHEDCRKDNSRYLLSNGSTISTVIYERLSW
jgi:hypothetical protein